MALYAVEITILMGDYEKSSLIWLEADNPRDAEYAALCAETHNAPMSREDYDSGEDEWWDDYMIYRIYSCHLIPAELEDSVRQLKFVRL